MHELPCYQQRITAPRNQHHSEMDGQQFVISRRISPMWWVSYVIRFSLGPSVGSLASTTACRVRPGSRPSPLQVCLVIACPIRTISQTRAIAMPRNAEESVRQGEGGQRGDRVVLVRTRGLSFAGASNDACKGFASTSPEGIYRASRAIFSSIIIR